MRMRAFSIFAFAVLNVTAAMQSSFAQSSADVPQVVRERIASAGRARVIVELATTSPAPAAGRRSAEQTRRLRTEIAAQRSRLRVALDPQSGVIGWEHIIVGESIVTGTPFAGLLVRDGVDHLSVEGAADHPYAIANQRTFPGWGYMLAGGATTLWEHWEGSDNTYSHNHPMFGPVSEWFYKVLGGIRPDPAAVGTPVAAYTYNGSFLVSVPANSLSLPSAYGTNVAGGGLGNL